MKMMPGQEKLNVHLSKLWSEALRKYFNNVGQYVDPSAPLFVVVCFRLLKNQAQGRIHDQQMRLLGAARLKSRYDSNQNK